MLYISQDSDLSGIFSGMSLSGATEKTTPPVKRVQPVKPVKPVQPEAPRSEVQETMTQNNSLAALLGMVSKKKCPTSLWSFFLPPPYMYPSVLPAFLPLFLSPFHLPLPPLPLVPLPIHLLNSHPPILYSSFHFRSFQNDPVADQQGGEPILSQADDSLVDFGGDQEEEFDPLKRTNSLTGSGTGGGHKTTQPPAVNSDLIGQLAGLDMSATTTMSDNILHPTQATSQAFSIQPTQTTSIFSVPPTTTFQMVPAGGMGMAFAMPPGHPMYGAAPSGAAMAGGVVPVMYPHAPGVVYMQQVGG